MTGTWYYGQQNSAVIATTTIVCLCVVVEDSGASWSLLLCQCHLTLSVPTVFGSQRPEDLRENGVLGSMGNCSRSTKGILGMGTEAGNDKIALMLALALGSSQQQSGLHPWVIVLAPSILP